MNILALDTSATACTITLFYADQLHAMQTIAPMQQTKLVLPMLEKILAEAGCRLEQLDAIAYGCGPGSFTGIRIATSVAQGLAYASVKPLIALSSLALLAQTVYLEHKRQHILVTVDARMQEIYWGCYAVDAEGAVNRIANEQVGKPDQIILPPLAKEEDWCVIGDGWDKYADLLTQRLTFKPQSIPAIQYPSPAALNQLALLNYTRGTTIALSDAIPVYLR